MSLLRGLAALLAMLWMLAAPQGEAAGGEGIAIFDAHVHYSQGAWGRYSPEQIKERLDRAGVRWALVSSSPDEGTLRLWRADPERVVPELRPYRGDITLGSWIGHPDVLPYLEDRLARGRYVGIGEFHVFAATGTERAFLARLARLAVEHGVVLHVHSGEAPIRMLFELEPELTVLWAHAGLSEPPEVVDALMRTHDRLYADTSFREGDIARGGSLAPPWREVLIRHHDRFLVGTDTYTAGRWDHYEAIVARHRGWLAQLPEDVAIKIAHGNALRLFGRAAD